MAPFKKGVTPPGAKPFKKGQSGNPKGRTPRLPHLDKLLADILGEEKNGISAAHTILAALRAKATKGDIRAAEVLLARAYGMPKQTTDLTTNGQAITQPLTDEQFNQLLAKINGSTGGNTEAEAPASTG